MNDKTLLTLLVLILTTASAAASAQFARPSREEMRSKFQERLAAADEDGNGVYSKAEVQAHFPRLGERFDDIDQDGDGQVTKAELTQVVEQFASRLRR